MKRVAPWGSCLAVRLPPSALALICLGGVNPASAGEWSFTPTITLAETYTDNVTLAPEGQEQGEFITQVNPGFSLRGRAARVRGQVDYRMQNLFYVDQSDASRTFHQLDALGSAEIWREHFFVDAASTVSQNLIDPQQSVAFSNRSVTGNRTDVITASVSPYVRQEFGSSAQALARYRYGVVEFDDDEVGELTGDSTVNGGWVGVGSLRDENRSEWLVAYQNERVKRQGSDATAKFERAGARLDFQLVRTIGLVGLGGYEDNDVELGSSRFDADGAFWEAGLRWEPGARDRLEARYGERFFGNTLFFSWNHVGRRFATRVSYTEDVTTLAQSLLGDPRGLLDSANLEPGSGNIPRVATSTAGPLDAEPAIDGNGLPSSRRTAPGNGIDPTGTGADLPLEGLTLTSDVFEAKRLDATLVFNTAKTTTTANVYQEDREFDDSAQDERLRGAGVLWDWAFAARTDFFAGLDYIERDLQEDDGESQLSRLRLGFAHTFGPRTFGRLSFARARERADDEQDEYIENAVTVSLTRAF